MYHPLQKYLPYLFEIAFYLFLPLPLFSVSLPVSGYPLQRQQDMLHQKERLQNRLSL